MRLRRIGHQWPVVALFVALAALAFAGPAGMPLLATNSAAEAPPPQVAAIESLPGGRTVAKATPKLESSLHQLAAAHGERGPEAAATLAAGRGLAISDDSVRIVVEAAADVEAASAAAIALGGRVEVSADNRVQVMMPIAKLEALAASPAVRLVRPPYRPVPLAVTSQGVTQTNANLWHSAGYTGTGVKVAVIDLGFIGYLDRITGGDLPANVITRSFRADGGFATDTNHGSACGEVVYDMAPGATLYLLNIDTDVELDAAVTWAISQGVKIVSHSVGWFNTGPGDGNGVIADTVTRALNAGILWVNAAGNHAQRHWSAVYTPVAGDTLHDFGGGDIGNTFSATVGSTAFGALSWNDPYGGSCNDYDLYLVKSPSGPMVASSWGSQNCAEDPTESIYHVITSTGNYFWAIDKYSGTARTLRLFSLAHDLEYQTAANSLLQPADSRNATSVGAVWYAMSTTIEYFSSQGPTTDSRTKPDIVGPDYVSNASYGSFGGTSAATPHVAGAAALVRQAYPTQTVTQTKAFLESRAVDLGAAGKDNVFGSGRLYLGATPAGSPTPTPTPTPSPTPSPSPTPTPTPTPTPSPTATPLPIIAEFIATNRVGVVSLTVPFTDESSSPYGINARFWNFGNSTSTQQNPVFTYTNPGVYTVSLTVTDTIGRSDTEVKASFVTAKRIAADFVGSPTSGMVPLTVVFTTTSQASPSYTETIAAYGWGFGDGTTVATTTTVLSHVYTSAGAYTVTHIVTGTLGTTDSKTVAGYISAQFLNAATSLNKGVNVVGSNRYGVISATLDRFYRPDTGITETLEGGLGAYTATMTYNSACVTGVSVAGVAPFLTPTVTITNGAIAYSASHVETSGPQSGTLAVIKVRLTGAATETCTITNTFGLLRSANGVVVPQDSADTTTARRGDAQSNNNIQVYDAMFIAQYVAGIIGASSIDPVSAASVRYDGAGGDTIGVYDAMFIAQYRAGIKNAWYQ